MLLFQPIRSKVNTNLDWPMQIFPAFFAGFTFCQNVLPDWLILILIMNLIAKLRILFVGGITYYLSCAAFS